TGVADVSPSRNMQFNPYGYLSGLHSLDNRDPTQPRFDNRNLQGKIGLDSKFVFHDSLVLDTTINPDFSQVESDQPQNTVNQRFEVFFPEKRPFFLENSNIFETLSGFQGDRQVLSTDPLSDRRAYFAIGRVAYDVGKNSSIGLIYTDREFEGDYNRVGGFDAHFKLGKNWNFSHRSVVSSTI